MYSHPTIFAVLSTCSQINIDVPAEKIDAKQIKLPPCINSGEHKQYSKNDILESKFPSGALQRPYVVRY